MFDRLSARLKYTLYGSLFGACFPLIATWIWSNDYNCSFFEAQTKYGHPLLWIINTAPLFLGIFASFAGSRQDVLENNLNFEKQKSTINAKLASVGEMSGQMAHELNNPLSILMGLLYFIKKELKEENPDVKKISELIKKSEDVIIRSSKIIKGIKDLSRDYTNDDLVYVNIKNVVQETVDLCDYTFTSKKIQLQIKVLVDCEVKCNPIQISQVLLNLLNNSRDAIQGQENPWIEISSFIENENICIMVRDSGHGIPETISKKLFEPFFTTKPQGIGTGLGLSISQNIIKKHGGLLEYNLDKGHTAFLFKLPKSDFIQ
jgi:C4-dicarboxylate-specific signal transduction histidine kinase